MRGKKDKICSIKAFYDWGSTDVKHLPQPWYPVLKTSNRFLIHQSQRVYFHCLEAFHCLGVWFFPHFLTPPKESISELIRVKTPSKTETRLLLAYSMFVSSCCSTDSTAEGVVWGEMDLHKIVGKQETFQTLLSLKPMFHDTQLVTGQLLRSWKYRYLLCDEVLK